MIPARATFSYTLTEADAESINRRRADAGRSGIAGHAWGAQVHVGNEATAGQIFPMIVVRAESDRVNGQVFLDGNDTLWVTSVTEGTGHGQFRLV